MGTIFELLFYLIFYVLPIVGIVSICYFVGSLIYSFFGSVNLSKSQNKDKNFSFHGELNKENNDSLSKKTNKNTLTSTNNFYSVLDQLKKEYFSAKYYHYKVDCYYLIYDSLEEIVILLNIYRNEYHTLQKFHLYDKYEFSTITDNKLEENYAYLSAIEPNNLLELNNIINKLKVRTYNISALFFNSKSENSEVEDKMLEIETKLIDEFPIDKIIENFEDIERQLLINGVFTEDEMTLIHSYILKYVYPNLIDYGTIINYEHTILSEYTYLKEMLGEFKYSEFPFSYLDEEITISFTNIVNLINRTSRNSFNENLVYIWLLIKKSINESLQLELKNSIDVENFLNYDAYEILSLIHKFDPGNVDKHILALAIAKKYPNENINETLDEYAIYYNKQVENYKLDLFQKELLSKEDEVITNIDQLLKNIDVMSGHEFEEFIADLYVKLGFKARRTKGSGDQGVDVIVVDNLGYKFGIQTKRSNTKVGNRAIQEIYSGINYYTCQKGIVITNNFFTKSAYELSEKSDIELINRSQLYKLLDTAYNSLNFE